MRLVIFGKKKQNLVGRCKGKCIPGCHSRTERVIWVYQSGQVAVSVCGFTHIAAGGL